MTDVKVEQCDINEAEEFRSILDSADAEYPSYAIPLLAEILARHRQAAEKAQQERDAGIADKSAATCLPLMNGIGVAASVETGRYRAATEIAIAIRSQGHE